LYFVQSGGCYLTAIYHRDKKVVGVFVRFPCAKISKNCNGKLTNINLSSVAVEIEPVKTDLSKWSVLPNTGIRFPTFSLDYYTDAGQTVTKVQ
jgi:hypothetical protein